jgi:hypothetical protein
MSSWDETRESYHEQKEFLCWLYLLAIQNSLNEIPAPHIDMCYDPSWIPRQNAYSKNYRFYNTLKMASSIMKKQKNWTSIELFPGTLPKYITSMC